jgi:N6-adenosine-specific RNA methylase IME4
MIPRSGYYGAILADPPWNHMTWSHKGKGRSASAYYDCMPLTDMEKMPVRDWAAKDCALFMWTTDPMLENALGVIRAWGFAFKTIGFVWAKTNGRSGGFFMGTGHWTRANPEICLLATRGAPKRISRAVRELIVAPRREHSRKPDEIYSGIEALVAGPYLELFARFPRDNWHQLGHQDGIMPRRWRSDAYPDIDALPDGRSAGLNYSKRQGANGKNKEEQNTRK